jgi:sec-independent protein translocase protein TatB
MLDIGWTELVVIAVVAILVVGPKDLPRMLRSFGNTMGQLRRSANEFKRQFDDALREAEREADLDDARKSVQSIGRIDPLSDLKKSVEKDLDPAKEMRQEARAAVAPPAGTAKPAAAKPDKATAEGATPAEGTAAAPKAANVEPARPKPAKAEGGKASERSRDSDAA